MNIPYETFKYPACKGDAAFGSDCGHCEKCEWIKKQEPAINHSAVTNNYITNGMTYLESCLILGYQCILEAMIAENKINEINGKNLIYGEKDFLELQEAIQKNAMRHIKDMKKQARRK